MVDRRHFIKLAAASIVIPSVMAETQQPQANESVSISTNSHNPVLSVEVITELNPKNQRSFNIGSLIGPIAQKDLGAAIDLANHIQSLFLSQEKYQTSSGSRGNLSYPEAIPQTEKMVICNPMSQPVVLDKKISLSDCKKHLQEVICNDDVVLEYSQNIDFHEENTYWLKTI